MQLLDNFLNSTFNNMKIMILPLVLVSFFFIVWVFLLKFLFRVSLKYVILGLFLGIFSYIGLIATYITFPTLFAFFFHIGIVVIFEEIAKFIPSKEFLKKYKLDLRTSLGFGSLIGLGFSFIENIQYLGSINMAVFRGILSSGAHILFTSVSIFGLWRSYKYKNKSWIFYLLISFLLHWSYNIIISKYW